MSELIEVEIIGRKGQAVLAQWTDEDGRLHRVSIPATLVQPGIDDEKGLFFVPAGELELGAAYGVPWAQLITFQASAEALERKLYEAGIWTVDDLRVGTQLAISALQSVYSVDLGALLRAAAEFDNSDMEVQL